MAITQIVNVGSMIELVDGSKSRSVSKEGLAVDVEGNFVVIVEPSGTVTKIDYSLVTIPAGAANADALRELVTAMVDEGASTSTVTNASSAATVAAANTSRNSVIIQNCGTNALYIKLGASASTSSFTLILKAGTANDDGNGGMVVIPGEVWKGIITAAGTSMRYCVTEL